MIETGMLRTAVTIVAGLILERLAPCGRRRSPFEIFCDIRSGATGLPGADLQRQNITEHRNFEKKLRSASSHAKNND
jgi:hypothetical protein